MIIVKSEDVFRRTFFGWGGGNGRGRWEDLSMEQSIMREESFHEGGAGFSSII